MPEPKDDEERQILFNLCEVAIKRNISLTVFERNEPLTVFGSGRITFGTPFFVRCAVPAESRRYATAAYPEYAAQRGKIPMQGADVLLLGCSGPVMKEAVPVPSGFPLVVLPDKAQLEHLILSRDCRYLYLPEKFRIILK